MASDRFRQPTPQLDMELMATTQDTATIPTENENFDLIFSFNKKGSRGKLNLTKLKNEFSFRRSIDWMAALSFILGLKLSPLNLIIVKHLT